MDALDGDSEHLEDGNEEAAHGLPHVLPYSEDLEEAVDDGSEDDRSDYEPALGVRPAKKRDDVIRTSTYKKIKEALPDFAEFILDEIQPYAGGKFKVWELSKLDNIDKHKLLIPTMNISSLTGSTSKTSAATESETIPAVHRR